MRLFTAVFCFSVALSFAAGSAEAGYVAPDWGSNTNNSLTATSSGLFWLNTGSGPSLLTTDINLEIWGERPKTTRHWRMLTLPKPSPRSSW